MSNISPVLNLGDVSVAAAGTQTTDWITGLDGMAALSIQAALLYGSGGTKIQAYVQTSIDQGVTPVDIACITFTAAAGAKIVNLSGMTPKTTEVVPADGALADDTCVDGILGDRLRLKVVSTGIYAGGTVLSVRAMPRG